MKAFLFASLTAILITTATGEFVATFTKNRITVGQNAGVVKLPIQVTGSWDVHPGAIDIKCIDGTAKDEKDYDANDDILTFTEAGKQKVAIAIKR